MIKFMVGDKVVFQGYHSNYDFSFLIKNRQLEKGMAGVVVEVNLQGVKNAVRVSWDREISGYKSNDFYNCWTVPIEDISLVERSEINPIIIKIRKMYERQPYVQQLKQHSDTTNSMSSLS